MIIHASIPADDPERVARVVAELWRGSSAPFPVVPGVFVARAEDERGSQIEVSRNLETTLARTPYLAGEAVTAADLRVAGGINFAVRVAKALPETPALGLHRPNGEPTELRPLPRR
jgi:glutathione S-transferase